MEIHTEGIHDYYTLVKKIGLWQVQEGSMCVSIGEAFLDSWHE